MHEKRTASIQFLVLRLMVPKIRQVSDAIDSGSRISMDGKFFSEVF